MTVDVVGIAVVDVVVTPVVVVVGTAVVPPHKHLNGHCPLTEGSPHVKPAQIAISGTGVKAQL